MIDDAEGTMRADAEVNAFDALNESLTGLEADLRAAGCTVPAEVPLSQPGGAPGAIGFGKVEGLWCLYLLLPGSTLVTPLRHTSRANRLAAVATLPALLTALTAARDRTAAAAEAARDTVQRLRNDLRGRGRRPQ